MIEELKKQTLILEQILKWVKIGNVGKVKEIMLEEFKDKNKILVYELSDGEKNIRDICEISGIKSTATISSYWNKWKKIGIVETIQTNRGERVKKAFDLRDFDIELPKINSKIKKNKSDLKQSKEGEEILNDIPSGN